MALSDLQSHALAAYERGWNVIPIHARKGPHNVMISTGHSKLNDEGRPVPSWKPFQTQRVTPELIKHWFHPRWRVPGLAAVTGQLSGLVVIDLDGKEGTELYKAWNIPASAWSGSGCPHLYFAHPGWPVRTVASGNYTLPPFPGLDVRGDGGLIVLPPSQLANGTYRAGQSQLHHSDVLPESVALWTGLTRPPAPALPELDLSVVAGPDDVNLPQLLADALSRSEGGRNNAGYSLARTLNAAGLTKEEAWTVLQQYAGRVSPYDARGRHDPYTLRAARSSLDSAYQTHARKFAPSQNKRGIDPIEQARALLPSLSATERIVLTRLLTGTYGRMNPEHVIKTITDLGLDSVHALPVLEKLKQNISVPGRSKLEQFLRTH